MQRNSLNYQHALCRQKRLVILINKGVKLELQKKNGSGEEKPNLNHVGGGVLSGKRGPCADFLGKWIDWYQADRSGDWSRSVKKDFSRLCQGRLFCWWILWNTWRALHSGKCWREQEPIVTEHLLNGSYSSNMEGKGGCGFASMPSLGPESAGCAHIGVLLQPLSYDPQHHGWHLWSPPSASGTAVGTFHTSLHGNFLATLGTVIPILSIEIPRLTESCDLLAQVAVSVTGTGNQFHFSAQLQSWERTYHFLPWSSLLSTPVLSKGHIAFPSKVASMRR